MPDFKLRFLESISPFHLSSILRTEGRAHACNFAIPNSEVAKVELKSRMRLNIKTSKKEHKWYGGGLSRGLVLPEREGKLQYPEDYENILRPIFGDRLIVKK